MLLKQGILAFFVVLWYNIATFGGMGYGYDICIINDYNACIFFTYKRGIRISY